MLEQINILEHRNPANINSPGVFLMDSHIVQLDGETLAFVSKLRNMKPPMSEATKSSKYTHMVLENKVNIDTALKGHKGVPPNNHTKPL